MLLFVERRPWDSNPQVFRPAVFKTASSPIRVTSVSYESKHRGQESNLRLSATNAARRCPEPDATTNSCYPGSGTAKDRATLALVHRARGRGFEPLSPDSKSGSLPLADPRMSWLRVPCGNRTRLSSLEGWRLCRSANGTCFVTSGRVTNPAYRPIGAQVELARQCQCSAAFEGVAIISWLALPYPAPAAGIEPA